MNRMKRLTIALLGAGLLHGATAARAEEEAPAAAVDAWDPGTPGSELEIELG